MKPSENKASVFHRYLIFSKKECTEAIRTHKLLILLCVFGFFAILSPLSARFMPDIMAWALNMENMNMDGLVQLIPDPVWTDAYVQLYANLAQMGIITLILVYMGSISKEKRSGTAALMFTKGLKPWQMVCVKFKIAALFTGVVLLITVCVTFLYTWLLFGEAGKIGLILFGFFAFWVYLGMMIAFILLGSSIAKSTSVAAVLGFVWFILFSVLNVIPRIGTYMPGGLVSIAVQASVGEISPHAWMNILIAVIITSLALMFSIFVLKRRED